MSILKTEFMKILILMSLRMKRVTRQVLTTHTPGEHVGEN